MSRNPLTNAADAAGDRFATAESGMLRVPGESPTTYEWQKYVERLELELENKSLGHVLRGTPPNSRVTREGAQRSLRRCPASTLPLPSSPYPGRRD